MSKKCIYCNAKENISVSDIIPDSMTFSKLKAKNVCKCHNNLTNSEFENAFANYFSFFRNRLGYLDRRNNEEIKFYADIYANNCLVLHNCYMSSLRNFFSKKIQFESDGNYHLINVNPKFCSIINQIFHIELILIGRDCFCQ